MSLPIYAKAEMSILPPYTSVLTIISDVIIYDKNWYI